jgi:hypothetical protein
MNNQNGASKGLLKLAARIYGAWFLGIVAIVAFAGTMTFLWQSVGTLPEQLSLYEFIGKLFSLDYFWGAVGCSVVGVAATCGLIVMGVFTPDVKGQHHEKTEGS